MAVKNRGPIFPIYRDNAIKHLIRILCNYIIGINSKKRFHMELSEMKRLGLALLVLVLIQNQGILLHVGAADGFIRTSGLHFVLNGLPYHANGFNAYWLMYVASDPSQRSKISSAFQEAASHGLSMARTWAFSDGGYKPLQYSPGSYNEQMFQVYPRFLLFVFLVLCVFVFSF